MNDEDPPPPSAALIDQLRAAMAREMQAAPGIPAPLRAGTSELLKTLGGVLPRSLGQDVVSEFANKFEAFTQFEEAKKQASTAVLSRGNALPPGFFGGNPAADPWRAEGLGACLATSDPTAPPTGNWCATLGIPARFLLPLHTGGGLTVAADLIRRHTRSAQPLDIPAMIEQFHDLAVARSSPGFADPVLEAFGLVVQTMHPDLLAPIADHLRERRPRFYRLFWHGAGRGQYFNPFHLLLPSAFRNHAGLSGSGPAALNLLAGYAWAVTLVNLRCPTTTATVLATLPLSNDASLAAAAQGVGAATLVWLTINSDHASFHRLAEALADPATIPEAGWTAAFQAAITRSIASHPAPPEAVGRIFSFDPEDNFSL